MNHVLQTGTAAVASSQRGGPQGLVIYPDIMGLRPLFEDHVERLSAELHWPVAAVEMYPSQTGLSLEERREAAQGFSDDDKLADLQAAADLLGCEKTNVMGFCMGGMYALKAAPHCRRAVSFYGMIRVPAMWRSATQGEPLEILGTSGSNVLAIIGGVDEYTPAGDVADLEATGASVAVYEHGEHGFVHDPERPAHRPDDAADAWSRVLTFLRAE